MVRAILSAVFACQIARCGAVLILMVKEILRRDLDKHVFYGEFASRSCTESYYKDFVQRSRQGLLRRSCQQSSFRAFVTGFFSRLLPKALLQGSCTEILRGHLLRTETLHRTLLHRFCQEVSYKNFASFRREIGCKFAKKPLTEILAGDGRDLIKRSCQETIVQRFCRYLGDMWQSDILQSDIAWRFVAGILPRGLLHKFCQETSYRKFVQRSCQENSHKILHESFQEVSYRDLAYRILFEILYEDLARRPFAEISCRNLVQRAQFLFRSCLRECKVQGSIRFIRHAREQPVLGAGPWRELVTICDNF